MEINIRGIFLLILKHHFKFKLSANNLIIFQKYLQIIQCKSKIFIKITEYPFFLYFSSKTSNF